MELDVAALDCPGIGVAVVGSASQLNRKGIARTEVLVTNAGYRNIDLPISGRALIGSVKNRGCGCGKIIVENKKASTWG